MYFAHDTEAALVAAVALVNTRSGPQDHLQSTAELARFLDEHSFTGRRDGTADELAAVRGLRDELRQLWVIEAADPLVPQINELLSRTEARPQLVRHDAEDWHLHVTDPQAALVDRMGAEAAMALVDLVRGQELHRLRTCAANGCDAVLVDLSRNSSRRFCDTGNCANRTHVAAHRARRRSSTATPSGADATRVAETRAGRTCAGHNSQAVGEESHC